MWHSYKPWSYVFYKLEIYALNKNYQMSVFVCANWQRNWEGSEVWKKWCSLLCHSNSKRIIEVKCCLKNYNVLSYPKMSRVTNCYLKGFHFFSPHDSTHVCGIANVIHVSILIYYILSRGLSHSFTGSADILLKDPTWTQQPRKGPIQS